MKTIQGRGLRGQLQKGFTLVELAIVLVIAGLILVGVMKGTDAINKAKVERMVSDMRGMSSTLLEFQKRSGRYAGDCDNNGVLANGAVIPLVPVLLNTWANNAGTTAIYDEQEANRVMPAIPVGTAGLANVTCTDNAPLREADINLAWNELRRAGVVDSNRLPRELARHAMNDVFGIGTIKDTVANGSQSAGVIVVYGIPVWMAEAIDASIDGQATTYGGVALTTGAANTGRVRMWQGQGTPMAATGTDMVFTANAATNTYDENLNDRDRLISISYQYTPEKLLQ